MDGCLFLMFFVYPSKKESVEVKLNPKLRESPAPLEDDEHFNYPVDPQSGMKIL